MNIVHTGNRFQVYGDDVKTYKELPAGTYSIGFHTQMGIWLQLHNNLQVKEEKVYGSHERKVEKVFNSFEKAERNFGIILSGKKGIGKSLFARMIAEAAIKRDMPVIIVDCPIPGISNFLSSIEQEVVIIFDEFEKTFARNDDGDPQVELLSLFDGVDDGKKLFVITCNDTKRLNEFLINRPGRFHYHFEIGCPTADEVRDYMIDAVGTGFQEEIEKVIKLSQIADITYDSLRAIAFDLKQGYPLEETLMDLNINYERNSVFDISVRLTNGWAMTVYGYSLNLYEKEEQRIRFRKDKNDFILVFSPSNIKSVNGTLTLMGMDAEICCDFDTFDLNYPSEEERERARKEFNENVRVEGVTFTKVTFYNVNKYVDI